MGLPGKNALLLRPVYGASNETRANARYRWDCRQRGSEPFVIVQWTHSGYGMFRRGRCEQPVLADQCFIAIVPEDTAYWFEAGAPEPWRFSWINFYDPLALQLWKTLREEIGAVFSLPTKSAAGLRFARLIRDCVSRRFADRYDSSLAVYGFLMTLLPQLCAPVAATPGRGRARTAAHELTVNRSSMQQTGIKTLASEAGVSREHFSRVFKAQHGETPAAFLRQGRLRAADEMLQATDLPLAEIALRCGFSSARQFADAYRASRGRSPQQFRTHVEGSGT